MMEQGDRVERRGYDEAGIVVHTYPFTDVDGGQVVMVAWDDGRRMVESATDLVGPQEIQNAS
jgi:hypothetical protein